MADYKIHIFKSLGNNKLSALRAECGRHSFRNNVVAYFVKTNEFRKIAQDPDKEQLLCSKCLQAFNERMSKKTV